MGGCTTSTISPALIAHSLPLRIRCDAPTMVTGTTGARSFAATEKAPFLKSAMTPSLLRVPSGKKSTGQSFCKSSRQSLSVFICDFRSVRFSAMCPVMYMLHPMIGMMKLLTLLMNLNGRRR
eukprot:31175-Pelagococcus_subviridis.AAC.2